MSATNTTTNYNLPIFIETDKPAWLVDFNGAMRAIDTQMKTNADAIATKSPILTFNDTADIDFTKSGDIITANLASAVSDKVGRALVTPVAAPASDQIVSINTSGQQAALEIGSGLFNNAGVLEAIDLNLTDTGTSTNITIASGANMSITAHAVRYAFNNDRSVGKVYGYIDIGGSGSGAFQINTNIIIPNISAAFTINAAGLVAGSSGTPGTGEIAIQSNGTIYLTGWKGSGSTRLIFWPTLYFFKDFGDQPI